MNNLHRELAPISDAAWSEIEEETSRTIKRYLAGRRVVDVQGPSGMALSAIGNRPFAQCHSPRRRNRCANSVRSSRWSNCAFPSNSIASRSMTSSAAPTIRIGSPPRTAARLLAFAEDRAIFEGYAAAGNRRHPRGHQQSGPDPSARCARLSRRHCPWLK